MICRKLGPLLLSVDTLSKVATATHRDETAHESCFVPSVTSFLLVILQSQCLAPAAVGKLIVFLLLFPFSFLLIWSLFSILNTFSEGIKFFGMFYKINLLEDSPIYTTKKNYIILFALIFTFRI